MRFKRLGVIWGIILLLVLAGCAGQGVDNGQQPGTGKGQDIASGAGPVEQGPVDSRVMQENLSQGLNKTVVVLYFGNSDGYLVPVRREIPKVQGIARASLQELIKGPGSNSGLQPVVPEGTKLRSVIIKNGLAVVDFSKELKSKHWGGSMMESLTVYAVVNTLTQFPSVQKVQILIEGQKVESLAGHIAIDRPVLRDSSIISASKN